MQLEQMIRKQTGIGPLSPNHILWLHQLIKFAFYSKSAAVILFAENTQNYIYAMPTDEPDHEKPRNSQPIDEETFKKHSGKANNMLKKASEKTEAFASLVPYYKIKIVREFPDKVKKSENLNDKIGDGLGIEL